MQRGRVLIRANLPRRSPIFKMIIMAKKLFILLLFLYTPFAFAATHCKIKRVLFVVAMEKEAKPMIKILHLHSVGRFDPMPMHAYRGKYNNLDVFLILNGKDPIYKVQNVGTQAAAVTTYLGIEKFHPDLVVSVGTAGAIVTKQVKPGTIYLSKKIYFYSRRIPGKDKQYGLGGYPSYSSKSLPSFNRGIICSGDDFDQTPKDYAMFLKLNCDVIEMEAASVAWVSELNHVPMIALKGITNNVENKNANAIYHKNFAMVANKLASSVKIFLDSLH